MWQVIGRENEAAVAQMEQFVSDHDQGHFMQLPRWAEAKNFWDWRGILVYRADKIVAAMSVLIRPLPLDFSLLYGPRGPVCDRDDPLVWAELMTAVREIAKAHRALLLYLDPDEPDTNGAFRDAMTELGFREKADDGFGNIQPQYVFRLALGGVNETDIYNAFAPKTRYNIRLSQRRGVTIREYSGAEDIPEAVLDRFCALMETTGQRDHFRVRGKAYFGGLLKALGSDARLFMAYYRDEPIAGTIEVFCGKKAWYLYGASANDHRNTMPNYLLQWTMIRCAIERGCEVYDFRGVPGNPSEEDPLYGLYRFKKGFSGTYTKFTGLFTYSFHPAWGTVLEKLVQLRRWVRNMNRKTKTQDLS